MGDTIAQLLSAGLTAEEATRSWKGIILIRLIVGGVFLSEGIQKFLFPAALGVGRFLKIGIPAPEILAPFVGYVEIVFGSLIILGMATRLATIPLLIDILVAIFSTKLPMLMAEGFWKAAHEARVDCSMLLGLVFLFIVGGGAWSFDAWYAARQAKQGS